MSNPSTARPLSIAILGTRGVPPRYGGFETFAAELGMRLIAHGHRVSVYCRELDGQRGERTWNGIERIVLPAMRHHKYFETVSHSFLSALDALRRDFDVVLVCNAANAFVLPILRLARIPVAINVDGVERKRRKWNVLGRAVYAIGESFSVLFADRVVADAHVIGDYYIQHYGARTTMIPYGADFPDEGDSTVLDRLGLSPRAYVLYVSRFEPENNPLEVVLAYEKLVAASRVPLPPLVMVGHGLYAKELVAELHGHASAQILFPGAVYGDDYRTLQRNALIYVQATEIGGTHPALIEAMGSGGCVVANGTPENREVGGDAVRYFTLRPHETLSIELDRLLADGPARERMRVLARARVAEHYSWNAVERAYERLFAELAG
jgi:glycosyltransferase involved in cell wall biosynthesis